MAIILVSPKEKQRTFFWIITAILVFSLVAISLAVFLPMIINKSQTVLVQPLVDTNEIVINLDMLHSPQVKNLEPFDGSIGIEFSYIAKDAKGKKVTGTTLAASRDEAQSALEASGLTVSSLQEITVGRVEPFVSY